MKTFKYEFVEFIPSELEEEMIYISIKFKTAVHLCACGCLEKVVTPLTPKDWKLIYDGKSISLSPSIGNWNYKCKSHYWIRKNEIIQVPKIELLDFIDYQRNFDGKRDENWKIE